MNATVRSGLLTEDTGDELVVVDEATNEVVALDPVAACVFRHADGSRDVGQLLAEVQASVDPAADAERVWSTLDRLADAGLLVERVTPPAGRSTLDRRRLLRVGAAGTAALGTGVVFTSVIPSAAAAASDPLSSEQITKLQEQGDKQGEQSAKEATAKGELQGKAIGEEQAKETASKAP